MEKGVWGGNARILGSLIDRDAEYGAFEESDYVGRGIRAGLPSSTEYSCTYKKKKKIQKNGLMTQIPQKSVASAIYLNRESESGLTN